MYIRKTSEIPNYQKLMVTYYFESCVQKSKFPVCIDLQLWEVWVHYEVYLYDNDWVYQLIILTTGFIILELCL